MKYFYIILRNGFIYEIPFKEEYYKGATAEMMRKGLMAVVPKGHSNPVIINSVDVSQILDEDSYSSFIWSTKPREYIENGIWRDGKERQILRYEKWKEEEINKTVKLPEGNQELTESQQIRIRDKMNEVKDSLEQRHII